MTPTDDHKLDNGELEKIRQRQIQLAQEKSAGTACTLDSLKDELSNSKERHHDLSRHHSS